MILVKCTGRSDAFLKIKKFFKNSVVIQVPRYLSHDINTIDEWKNAEWFLNL